MELKDKVAIVTGGSRGIGYMITQALIGAGMQVAICARNQEELDRAKAELNRQAGREAVLTVRADVSSKSDVDRLVQETLDRWGQIDVLVNNAAVGGGGEIEQISEQDWDRIHAIDLKGVYLCSQAVFPAMKRRQSGYIINISSWAGKEGMAGLGAYCAAKFGVVGLTQTLQQEGKDVGIRASVICPGATSTRMNNDSGERLRPDDTAKAILFLLSLSDLAVVPEIGIIRRTSL